MEQTKKRKVFGIIMRIVFFLVLSGAFLWLYHSPFSYFNDSYGLLKGPREPVSVENLMDSMDFVYIECINGLYLFLGEKPGVVIGFHIFLRMINCLLLFFSVEKLGKPVLSGFFTLLYGFYPFAVYELYNCDSILIAEFFCILLLFLISSLIKAVFSAVAARRRQKEIVLDGGVSPQWEAENQMFGQETFRQEELTEGILTEKIFPERTFPEKILSEVDGEKYSSGLVTEKALQVEKTGGQMRQDGVMAQNMEKEKVVKERDGVPNFLELTDEEIRRNAMIAAGLLSPEEERKPETDENGAAKKTSKKKSKDKGEKKPLFRKGREKAVQPENIQEAEALKGTEWTEGQKKQPDPGFEQPGMGTGTPDMRPELSNTGTGTPDMRPELSNAGTGQPDIGLEPSNEGVKQPSVSHTQFIENPLPVPKRHVKKEMDYEYQVPEEKMHYDIEEPDKNYFDVV